MESGKFHLFLCGRLITFETVVFHCFGFREQNVNLIKLSLIFIDRYVTFTNKHTGKIGY